MNYRFDSKGFFLTLRRNICLVMLLAFMVAPGVLYAQILSMTTGLNASTVTPGSTIRISAELNMNNSSCNSGARIVLQLPAQSLFVPAPTISGNGTWDGAYLITWQLPLNDTRPNSNSTYWAEIAVDPNAVAGDVFDWSFALFPNGPGLSCINKVADDYRFITGSGTASPPKLNVSKLAAVSTVLAGGQLTYTLEYENAGATTATNVQLEDSLTAGLSFVSASGNASHNGGIVTWDLGDVDAGDTGSVSLNVDVDSALADGTVLSNEATIRSDQTTDVISQPVGVSVSTVSFVFSKRGPLGNLKPGQQATYSLSYRNSGSADATGVVLQDMLPPELNFVSASSGASHTAGTVTWNLATIPAGASGFETLTVLVDPSAPGSVILTNSATLTSNETAPVSAAWSLSVESNPLLEVKKTANRNSVPAGELITYTLEYANIGNADAQLVTLTDTIPANTSFEQGSGVPVLTGSSVQWNLGTIAPGTSGSETLTLRVDSPLADGTQLQNLVELSAGNVANPVSALHDAVVSSARLNIAKTSASSTANPGDTIQYTIDYSNTGSIAATDVIITDTLPASLVFTSATGNFTQNGNTITWDIGSIPAWQGGSLTVSARVSAGTPNGTIISNSATISNPSSTNPLQPVSSGAGSAIVTVLGTPLMSFDKTVATIARPGDQLIYQLTYRNTGTATATGVQIEDTLPAGVTLDQSYGATVVGNTISWTIGTVPPGIQGDVIFTAHVDSPAVNNTLLTNTALLKAAGLPNQPASASTTIVSEPRLELHKAISRTSARPGDTITFTLNYENAGTDEATAVVLEDLLPSDTTFVSASSSATHNNDKVTWNIGTVAAGASGSETVTVKVNSPLSDGTQLNNVAYIDSLETNTYLVSAPPVTVSSAPVLQIDKLVSQTTAVPGDTLTYHINVRNTGTDKATMLVVEDVLPAGVTYISSNGGIHNSGRVVWTIPALAAGSTTTLTLLVSVNSGLPDGTLLDNFASVSSDQTPSVSAGSAGSQVTISAKPVLELVKVASSTTVTPGQALSFTLEYVNTGTGDALNTVITDGLPPELTVISVSTGGSIIDPQTVQWNIGTLQPWQRGQVSLTALVESPIANNTILNNIGLLDAINDVTNASATVRVQSAPLLQVRKTPSQSTARPGDSLVYTINYANTGTDQATSVKLTDQLPPELTFLGSTGGGTDNGGGLISWDLGTLPANTAGSVTLSVLVNSPLADGTVIQNSASIDSVQTTPVASPVAPAEILISSAPLMEISKTASPTRVTPGKNVTYTLFYRNTGTDTATGVVLTDSLAPQLSFVSASGGGMENNGRVSWNLGNVPAGTSGSVTVTATTVSPLSNRLQIFNTASISSATTGPVTSPPNQGVVNVASSPRLQLTKTVSATLANAGQQLVYTLEYENTGTDIATAAVLEDSLPGGVSFVSASGGGVNNAGVVTWNLGDLSVGSPGSVTLTVAVDSPIANGTVLDNLASLGATGTPSVTAMAQTVVNSAPQLNITKRVDRTTVNAGGQLVYTIDYSNTGTDTATNVVIEDTLPASVDFVSANAGGVFTSGTVRWLLASLPAGSSGSVALTGRARSPLADGTQLHNTASIHSDVVAPISSAADSTVSSAPRFTLALSVDKATANPGATLLYRLEYRNIGSDAATNPVLQFILPSDVQYSSATGGGSFANGVVTWAEPAIAAGAAGLLLVEVTVDSPLADGTALSGSASVDSVQTKPLSAGPVITTVQSSPQLSIAKHADRQQVGAGLSVTYTIDYANTGTDQATGVVIEDQLPANVTFLSATAGGSHAGGVVTWNPGTVVAGASGSVAVTVRVNSPLPDGTLLHNSADIDSNETQPMSTGVVNVKVNSQPELTLEKLISASTVAAGGQITYTLIYENGGTSAALGTLLADNVPANTVFVAASAGGQYDAANQIVFWNLGDVPALTSGSVQATFEVLNPLANGTRITNAAAIGANNANPQTASASFIVSSAPLLAISKSSLQDNITPGGVASFSIELDNSGSDQALDVVVNDRVPAGAIPSAITPAGSFDAATRLISWTLPSLDSGSSALFTYDLQAPLNLTNGSPFLNTVDASAQNASPVSASLVLPVQSQPVLNLTKSAPNSVEAGDMLDYTLSYTNTGNAQANALIIEDVLPAGTSFISASDGGTESGGTVSWLIGDLAPGAAGSVSLIARADLGLPDGYVLLNNASVRAANAQPVSASGRTVVRSHVELTLSISGAPNPVDPGGQVAFLVTYGNIGNQDSAATEIRATLPAGTSFAGAVGGGIYDSASNSVVWSAGALPPGPQVSVNFLVNVDPSLAGGTLLTSSASATDRLAQPVSAQARVNVSGATVTPVPLPPVPVPLLGGVWLLLLVITLLGLAWRQLVLNRRHR